MMAVATVATVPAVPAVPDLASFKYADLFKATDNELSAISG